MKQMKILLILTFLSTNCFATSPFSVDFYCHNKNSRMIHAVFKLIPSLSKEESITASSAIIDLYQDIPPPISKYSSIDDLYLAVEATPAEKRFKLLELTKRYFGNHKNMEGRRYLLKTTSLFLSNPKIENSFSELPSVISKLYEGDTLFGHASVHTAVEKFKDNDDIVSILELALSLPTEEKIPGKYTLAKCISIIPLFPTKLRSRQVISSLSYLYKNLGGGHHGRIQEALKDTLSKEGGLEALRYAEYYCRDLVYADIVAGIIQTTALVLPKTRSHKTLDAVRYIYETVRIRAEYVYPSIQKIGDHRLLPIILEHAALSCKKTPDGPTFANNIEKIMLKLTAGEIPKSIMES